MTDKEKVVKGLECHRIDNNHRINCADCPYYVDDDNHIRCVNDLHDDAISLLKESVPQGVVDQIRWERNTAMSQLEQIGKGLGSKMDDVVALLKEPEAVEWINVKDKLPEKDGQYLVVYTFFDYKGMGVVRFSHNLHEIDEYIFDTENRPGWYEPDDEVGYFERTTVTHWAKLPEFPTEGR